jgi:hypothetical protein
VEIVGTLTAAIVVKYIRGMLSRRTFISWLSGVGAALGLGVLAKDGSATPATPVLPGQSSSLDPAVVASLAAAVLPSELGESGFTRVGREFSEWIGAYRAGVELVHPYGSTQLRNTGESPLNLWRAHLAALDQQARQQHQRSFNALTVAQRRELVTAAISADRPNRLPDPLDGSHVALALMAWYFASPDAINRCYSARIDRNQCRPLVNAPRQPLPLSNRGAS